MSSFADSATADFFRARLDHMIDLRHELAVLTSRMPWQQLEATLAHRLSRQAIAGKKLPGIDLFGESIALTPRVNRAGRPRVPLRIMMALLYLQNAFNLSDEAVVARWAENPYWQYFSGLAYFEPRPPCDGSLLVKFRKLIGEEGVEELLAQTVQLAVQLKLIRKQDLQTVVVDTTVQSKAVAHPTDSRLLEVARSKLVDAAKNAGIALKQTFVREGAQLLRKARGYAHARQFKRLRKTVNRQRTVLGRLLREVQRKQPEVVGDGHTALQQAVQKASQLHAQTAQRANRGGKGKLYAWHAPEVECISKGKARTPYEFGVKAGICTTLKGNLIVGARSFPGNPYDGHTLHEQLEQATIVMQETGVKPTTAVVDLGYRGVDALKAGIHIIHRGKTRSLTPGQRKLLRRRQSIEPVIGHLKADHRMDRCWYKGHQGDALRTVLSAVGFNLRWLLRKIVEKGIAFFCACPFALAQTIAGWMRPHSPRLQHA